MFRKVQIIWKGITNQKKKDKFYAEHNSQIDAYKAMRAFFKNTLGEGEKITPKAWQSELAELESADSADMLRLHKLEDSTAIMATILYNVEHLQAFEDRQQENYRKRNNALE